MTTSVPGVAASGAALQARLEEFVGREVGPPMRAPDPVNLPMIRHWVEAMGDENPVYLDEDAARANGFAGIVAPATMLQAWIMRGYKVSMEAERARAARTAGGDATTGTVGTVATDDADTAPVSAQEELFALLDDAGFTSVVATNCEQEYHRPLVLGDLLTVSSVIESVSPEKRTGLGDGHFVTTRLDYTDKDGGLVATMRFRILRFRPKQATTGGGAAPAEKRPLRPRPAITHDNAFFFEGTKAGKLLIQRCASCGKLRHPPRPSCDRCRSLEWDTVEASGRGSVFSFVVVHHPQVPAFDYPLPIAVVELEEGTRLVADLVGVEPGEVRIGMPVVAELAAVDEDLTLPMFRPADAVVAQGATQGGR